MNCFFFECECYERDEAGGEGVFSSRGWKGSLDSSLCCTGDALTANDALKWIKVASGHRIRRNLCDFPVSGPSIDMTYTVPFLYINVVGPRAITL